MGLAKEMFGKKFDLLSVEEKRQIYKLRYKPRKKEKVLNSTCYQMFGEAFRKLNPEQKRLYWNQMCRRNKRKQTERIAQSVFGTKVRDMNKEQYREYMKYCVQKRTENKEKENS